MHHFRPVTRVYDAMRARHGESATLIRRPKNERYT